MPCVGKNCEYNCTLSLSKHDIPCRTHQIEVVGLKKNQIGFKAKGMRRVKESIRDAELRCCGAKLCASDVALDRASGRIGGVVRDDLRSAQGDVTTLPGLIVADNDWNSTAAASGRLLRSSVGTWKIGNDLIPHERMTNS